jgi:hypothetical protein
MRGTAAPVEDRPATEERGDLPEISPTGHGGPGREVSPEESPSVADNTISKIFLYRALKTVASKLAQVKILLNPLRQMKTVGKLKYKQEWDAHVQMMCNLSFFLLGTRYIAKCLHSAL